MTMLCDDGKIACDDTGLLIRRYYPWGAKRIPYESIALSPHGRVHPEPELVDEAALHEHGSKLAAPDQSEIAFALLELGDALDDVPGDQRGVPLERLCKSSRGDELGIGLMRSAHGPFWLGQYSARPSYVFLPRSIAPDRSNSARQASSCLPSGTNHSSSVITLSTVICVERTMLPVHPAYPMTRFRPTRALRRRGRMRPPGLCLSREWGWSDHG